LNGGPERVYVLLTLATAALLALALLFAVVAIVLRLRNTVVERRWARLEAAWTPPLLEILAGDLQRTSLLRLVARADRFRFADFLLRFARRLKGPEREVLRTLAAPVMDTVAERARRGSPERRAVAVQILGALGLPAQLVLLRHALDDPSPVVAMTAARALARRAQPAFIGDVVAHLPRFERWSFGFLASTLAAFGPAAAPALRAVLGDGAQPAWMRIVTAEALRMLHDPSAADRARAALDATDPDLRAAALRLLAAVGRPEDAPAVRALASSPVDGVRAQAVAALASLGGAADVPLLRAALDDPSPWVVLRAAQSFKALGGVLPAGAPAGEGGLAALALAE